LAISVFAAFSFVAIPGVQASPDTTYYVNATSGNDSYNNTQAQDPATPWKTISHAVTNATAGDTINVAAGTYDEQVVIDKSLTLQGEGDTTIIKPSQGTANNFTLFSRKAGGGDNTAPIIVASEAGSINVTIKDLKVNGSLVTSVPTGATKFVGILYRGTGGLIDSVTVRNISNAGSNGGDALYLSPLAETVTIEVTGCNISDYYKNGITANYAGLTANIHDNTVTGLGPVDYIAQNGIQIGFGATGTIQNNSVSSHSYTGGYWAASGILVYQSSGNTDTLSNNPVRENLVGIYYYNSSSTIDGNTVTASATGVGLDEFYGIIADPGDPQDIPRPAPVDEGEVLEGMQALLPGGNTYTINVTNNNVDGDDSVNATGIAGVAWSPNTLNFKASGNTVTDWAWGFDMYQEDGATLNANANFNNIMSNVNYGAFSNTPVNFTNNWWGDENGPSGEGVGSGDAVSANVNYDPWLDAPYPGGESINFTDAKTETAPAGTSEIDATTEADTNVSINTTAPVNVTIGNFSKNPGTGFGGDIGKYIDVHLNDTANVTNMTIKLFYINAELNGLDESSLKLYWWARGEAGRTGGSWVSCSNTGVDTTDQNGYSGYIWAYIDNTTTTPRISDMTGQPFGGRGSPPVPVPEYNIFGLLALIGILSVVLGVATMKRKSK
jgi:parallel beta-helix repeat protein